MGASLQHGGGSSRRHGGRRARRAPMSEINVTPFVDVMLVLLIIFMVTAPLLTAGVQVDLPKSETPASADASQQQVLTVSVARDGRIYIQEAEIGLDEVGTKLTAIAKAGAEQTVYVRGDAQANYGALMQVMGKITAAGFQRISLVTDVEERS
jgi:biopolymer transport protein TolR